MRAPPHARVWRGIRHPSNWLQLARFAVVGASGYALNLAVFAFCFDVLGTDHRLAATLAFLIAVTNNFWWNRHWTFRARDGHAGFQAVRFFAVSAGAFLFALGVLEVLVTGVGLAEIVAQAISIVVATPLNFLGNRLWSFRQPQPAASTAGG